MTIEIFEPAPIYLVQNAGPFEVPHPYETGTIRAAVIIDGSVEDLDPSDFTVTPATSPTGGDIHLTPAIAAQFAGSRLTIWRETPEEQGWLGILGEREKGLETQLDRIVMALQELRTGVNSSVRGLAPMQPFEPRDGHSIVFRNGSPAVGPNVDALTHAEEFAERAEAAAEITLAAANFTFADKGAMLASTRSFALGTIIQTRKEGGAWTVASGTAPSPHETTAGGIRLYEAGWQFSSRARAAQAVARGERAAGQILFVQGRRYRVDALGPDGLIGLDLAFHGRCEAWVSGMLQGAAGRAAAFADSTDDGNGSTGWTANPVDGAGDAIGTAAHTPPNAWPQVAQDVLRAMFKNANIHIHNAGYSGQQLQTGWARRNFARAVLGPYPTPDAVIIGFGINDVRQAYFDPATFETELLRLCDRIDQIGAFPIFRTPDEPSDERHNGWLLGKVVEIYRAVAARIGVRVIDWGTAMHELSQCSDATSWRWGADQPDDTHGNDTLHSVKGSFVAASLYPHTLFVRQPITDIAPWSRYCSPIPGYSVYQGAHNKFGACLVVPAGSYTTDQFLLDIWVWSVGAARTMSWAAVDANGYFAPRTVANAPLIGLYDYVSKTTQTIIAPGSAAAAGPDGARDAEAMGLVYRVPQGLSRWAFRAPRDNNAADVYLGYFSIREVRPQFSMAVAAFGAAAAPTIIDRDPEGDVPQILGIQHGRVANLAMQVTLSPGMGVSLWSSRVYGGSVTREAWRKRGLFLFRHASDGRLFLYSTVFNWDGSIGTSASLGSSPAALTWTENKPLRLAGGVNGTGQYISIYDGWSSNAAIISATNLLSAAPLPWGGTPGAIWQHTGVTGVASLTIHGAI